MNYIIVCDQCRCGCDAINGVFNLLFDEAMLPMCTIFCHALKILLALIFKIAINSLTR